MIATLGMSQVLIAFQLKIADNRQITGAFSSGWSRLGTRDVLGVPIVVVYLLVLAVVLWFTLEHTPVGRYLFAVGGNPDAARLAGLNVERLTVGSLMASATIAGLAGVIFSMKVGTYSSSTGPGLLFPALAAVFFGASQFTRRPNVWGTLVAYFTLAFGVKGLQLAFGPGTFWIQPLFQGAALLIAVALASRVVGETRRSRRQQREAALAAEAADSGSDRPTRRAELRVGRPCRQATRHQGEVPPSTFNSEPVMPAPASEASSTAIAATSSTVFSRLIIDSLAYSALYSSYVMPKPSAYFGPTSIMSAVSIAPGQIALLVMPFVPYSKATALVKPLIACLFVM